MTKPKEGRNNLFREFQEVQDTLPKRAKIFLIQVNHPGDLLRCGIKRGHPEAK